MMPFGASSSIHRTTVGVHIIVVFNLGMSTLNEL